MKITITAKIKKKNKKKLLQFSFETEDFYFKMLVKRGSALEFLVSSLVPRFSRYFFITRYVNWITVT